MEDMAVWYVVLLVGTACVILVARSYFALRKRASLGEVSSEDLEVVDAD